VLTGERITLRPVHEADLATAYAAHTDIANRGAFFPLGVMSEPAFRQRFAETGFWEKTEGMLLILTPADEIVGHIEPLRR
jgi:[ribosomal protein S5]-alanine N-acetyltransferase